MIPEEFRPISGISAISMMRTSNVSIELTVAVECKIETILGLFASSVKNFHQNLKSTLILTAACPSSLKIIF
jgi:hypothetical protein